MELAMQKGVLASATPTEVARLTRSMQRGEEEAYREFFHLYFRRLLAYLLAVTHGNETLARELVQQTMIKVAKHIRVFDDEEILWRWLTLLARTAAIDEGRKSKRYFAFLDRWWNRYQSPADLPPGEDVAELSLTLEIEKLPEEDRFLIGRKYTDGCSVKDLADELGTTEKAIESKLSRLRAKLKEAVLKSLKDAHD